MIDSVWINSLFVTNGSTIKNVNFRNIEVKYKFSEKIDTLQFNKRKLFFSGEIDTSYNHVFSKDSKSLIIKPIISPEALTTYRLLFDLGENLGGTILYSYSNVIITCFDTTPKFPQITDDSLLTLVQKQTFAFFWDHAHPVSGLIRDRLGSGDIVTTGGSGFGMMAILTGIERNFISYEQGFDRLRQMIYFLNDNNTGRFHGAFPHWLNGSTGEPFPFSSNDDGGDLVETAFLMEGMLTVREYFKNGNPDEKSLCDTIQKLFENIEWTWYQKDNQDVLYWHWSPNFNWEINLPVSGWNEALLVYVLAAGSRDYSISKEVYDNGWARNGSYPMINGNSYYNITLPLGENYGGPLFFAHYSFLGLDPRNLSDQYAGYMEQNTAHSLINYEYCRLNPKKFYGYGENCWGLTASDIQNGYTASSPTNDRGVIAPTAALSSFPYTPSESMKAMKFFYYTLGDKLWGEYGFYDSFNLNTPWFANSYLAIDQGPVICMIENYRTGLLWNLFMSSDEVKKGLITLGFTY